MSDHDMAGYDRTSFTHRGKTREVLRRGSGPAVIVMAEIPGITPKVLQFAEQVVGVGCTAVLPVLFGTPGKDPDPKAHGQLQTLAYAMSSILPACVSREFVVWATGKTSPVIGWLRALAAEEHQRCGGPGVGAVGMCFTGGYALAMAVDDRIVAPVLSQPSCPFGVTAKQRSTIDISTSDLEVVKGRCAHDDLKVIGLRFKNDRFVPAERFAFLRDQLGDRRRGGRRRAHRMVTAVHRRGITEQCPQDGGAAAPAWLACPRPIRPGLQAWSRVPPPAGSPPAPADCGTWWKPGAVAPAD